MPHRVFRFGAHNLTSIARRSPRSVTAGNFIRARAHWRRRWPLRGPSAAASPAARSRGVPNATRQHAASWHIILRRRRARPRDGCIRRYVPCKRPGRRVQRVHARRRRTAEHTRGGRSSAGAANAVRAAVRHEREEEGCANSLQPPPPVRVANSRPRAPRNRL